VQFTTARLIEDASTQTRPKDVKFGLAQRSLQTKQQSVVEVRGIVDAVFIQDECARQCADLQQPMPVGRVARQTRNFKPQHDPGSRMPPRA
jgi:hypothetical protein